MSVTEIVGAKVVSVRSMTDQEASDLGWDGDWRLSMLPVIELDNGTKLFPSQDEEGNGPGVVFGQDKHGEEFYLLPGEEGGAS